MNQHRLDSFDIMAGLVPRSKERPPSGRPDASEADIRRHEEQWNRKAADAATLDWDALDREIAADGSVTDVALARSAIGPQAPSARRPSFLSRLRPYAPHLKWAAALVLLCVIAVQNQRIASLSAQRLSDDGLSPDALRAMAAIVQENLEAASKREIDTLSARFQDRLETMRREERAEYAYRLGLNLNDANRYAEALRELTEAVELKPDSPAYHLARGQAHQGMMNHAQAIADFSRAIELDPSSALAHSKLGWTFAAMGNVAGARTEFEKAVALHRGDAELAKVVGDRGWSLIQEAKQAKGKQPDDAVTRKLLEAVASLNQAREAWERENSTAPELAHVYNNLAWAFNELGWIARDPATSRGYHLQAIKAAKQAVEIIPTFGWALNSLADAYTGLGDDPAAINAYSRALEVDPTNAQVYCNRATVYARSGEDALAERDRKHARMLGMKCD